MRWLSTDGVRLGGILENFEVTELSSAQILALDTDPVVLLPAPGPGRMIVVLGSQFSYRAGTTPYTTANSPVIVYDGPSKTGCANFNIDLSSAVDQVSAQPAGQVSSITPNEVENVAILMTMTAGDVTLGDGTLSVALSYSVYPV